MSKLSLMHVTILPRHPIYFLHFMKEAIINKLVLKTQLLISDLEGFLLVKNSTLLCT